MQVSGPILQVLVAATVFSSVALFVHSSAKNGKLSFRYAIGWFAICTVGGFFGVISPAIGPIAEILEVTPNALLSVAILVLLLVLCIQLSISISGLHERVRTLVEKVGQLESEIKKQNNE